ncbi:MAG: hypothetical protein EZS28_018297 [Streblomastix strix]|uniref:Uncharacterized protein n=1 Tax=Streblomastix strix TaxID=222440 RepID=A0A5J4VU75_9EUKA|nr:MAG: hypothetical protein EZS28_018297 [Streblomastix strix]
MAGRLIFGYKMSQAAGGEAPRGGRLSARSAIDPSIAKKSQMIMFLYIQEQGRMHVPRKAAIRHIREKHIQEDTWNIIKVVNSISVLNLDARKCSNLTVL